MAFGPLAGTSGIRSSFLASVEALRRALPNNLGAQIGLRSGWRSRQHQSDLFDRAVRKYGSVAAARKWVAPPGRSQHGEGNAIDFTYGSRAAMQAAHEYAPRFGLVFPMSYENWHIEPIGARGRGSASPSTSIPAPATALGLTGAASPPDNSLASAFQGISGGDQGGDQGGGLPSISPGSSGGNGIRGDFSAPQFELPIQPIDTLPEADLPSPIAPIEPGTLAGLFTLPTIGGVEDPNADPLGGQAKPLARKVWK